MATAQASARPSLLARVGAFLTGAPAAQAPSALPSHGDLVHRDFTGVDDATLRQQVQELLDREEIKELAARYALRTSKRGTLADLYIENGTFTVRFPGQPPQQAKGRVQLEKAYASIMTNPNVYMPKIHNHLISISGDEAVGIVWAEVHTHGGDGQVLAAAGHFQDRMRRENGRWKFVERDFTMVVMGSVIAGGGLPPASS
jgi:hypothetical protein